MAWSIASLMVAGIALVAAQYTFLDVVGYVIDATPNPQPSYTEVQQWMHRICTKIAMAFAGVGLLTGFVAYKAWSLEKKKMSIYAAVLAVVWVLVVVLYLNADHTIEIVARPRLPFILVPCLLGLIGGLVGYFKNDAEPEPTAPLDAPF